MYFLFKATVMDQCTTLAVRNGSVSSRKRTYLIWQRRYMHVFNAVFIFIISLIVIHSLQSESPTRKRRKVSQSVIDLTNDSPSPPVASQHWENPSDRLRQSTRRRSSMSQRRASNERCSTPRLRRRLVI